MSESAQSLPRHIAIIMDGNGRWAKAQGKQRTFGHRAGVKAVRSCVEYCSEQSIPFLTLFAFSSENWKRPRAEVTLLLELLVKVLGDEVHSLHNNNVQLKVLGDLHAFPSRIQNKIQKSIELTSNNTGLVLSIAMNYGGRWDVAQASQRIAPWNEWYSVGE